ncbi:MAG TPA: polyphosphate kinase 1 [Candidatus Copromonas avistercoris]|nr:polyphosphate kinase 1 [Candidatus Copromonas avistercoris]
MKKEIQKCFINRELSWLKFNERVLEEAADETIPLCERLSFLSIFQSNLDEFFMVRVGSIHDMQLLSKPVRENKTNMTAGEQIDAILAAARELTAKKDWVYEQVMSQVVEQGIQIVDFHSISDVESGHMKRYFEQEIQPLLSTIVVGKKQPFPFLQNKEIYAAAVLETKNEKAKIGIIPCGSRVFERLIPVPTRPGSYMLAEELILHYLPSVFSKYKVTEKSIIRVTRNADIDADRMYDEDSNYREYMEELIKQRRRLCPIRLEMTRSLDTTITDRLCQILELEPDQVFLSRSPLDLSFVSGIRDALHSRPELFYKKRSPQPPAAVDPKRRMLDQALEHDILLSYPYESMKPFLNMLHEAAVDPKVVSIKMTLYRLAKDSKVVEALVEAAENGKQVDVLVELKARFDEENNIAWSRLLEDAGCHVIYGLDGYKVHSKLCLITRKDENGIEYITQVGTGNYNEKTSRLYTDLSLITRNQEIGLDALEVFKALSMGETVEQTKCLLVAPNCLQSRVLSFIDREIGRAKEGKEAYIGIKINSLTDKKIMDKLIEASQAGAKVEMIIRGICCLQPGIEGYTENIHVTSIVGRYLEHSRIYIFGAGEHADLYLSSADFMTRNTERRVEVAIPLYDPEIRTRVQELFGIMASDNVKARELCPDGIYRRVPAGDTPLNAQEALFDMAYEAHGARNIQE